MANFNITYEEVFELLHHSCTTISADALELMNAALAKSHFRNTDWGKKPLGHIILQDHHSEVFFRNIKIHVLTAPDAK